VILEVRRQSDANSVAVIDAVKVNLAAVEQELPAGVTIQVARDQSRYINEALGEINLHLVLGGLLASLVVFAFMRNLRSTLIAAVAIPCSVISTFGMMAALGFTLNSVTMLALVLMVGIVIDDAIVVLENIFRWIEEKQLSPFDAAREATAEIALPVMATTACLVVIFIPVSFMSSISGRFLYQFGITAAVAILVSLLVSFTLTPMMSARLLRAEDAGGHGAAGPASRRGFYGRIDRWYTRMLTATMKRRYLAAAVCVAVMIASFPLFGLVKVEYIPSDVDESEFDVNVNAPEGTSLPAIDEAMKAIEADIRSVPGVRTVLSTAGGGFLGGVNQGRVYVRIAPHEERKLSFGRFFKSLARLEPLSAFRGNYSQRDVMNQVRGKLRKYTDLRSSVRNVQSFNLGGGNWDIDFALRGPDLNALTVYANRLVERSKEIGGIIDADVTLKLDKPELQVAIDRERAADLGVDMEDVATALRLMVGGDQEVSRFRDPTAADDYDVQLRLVEAARNNPGAVPLLYVPSESGELIRLDNLVKLEEVTTASRIDRLDRQRQVSVRAGVGEGYALADRIEALRQEVAKMNLPPTYSTAVSGRARELERTRGEFAWALMLSIVFMYMILAAQFESLVHPLTILLSLPLAVPFALLALWGTNNTLNLYSALGVLVLFGVVKKNAILQIDHMNNLRAAGMAREQAILQGNRDRLRPILMTTLALVAGMLPLALGTGPGAEERRAIAVVVIGGQTLSLLLTLLATPVFYSLFDDLRDRHFAQAAKRLTAWRPRRTRRASRDEQEEPLEPAA
ncbi:MAG TPA: efflux RND transporter permease subunit, partial [Thermoanaerobaculia bacterium]|nr:efflux RND transporter permease subunit [Thermoanaerobaculia bacterium]